MHRENGHMITSIVPKRMRLNSVPDNRADCEGVDKKRVLNHFVLHQRLKQNGYQH
jgi:hypothetical protein